MLIFKRGYHLIGALKTNRIIYPKGYGIQIKQFTQYKVAYRNSFLDRLKNNLGINKYQVRSSKAIDRILLLASLTYTY